MTDRETVIGLTDRGGGILDSYFGQLFWTTFDTNSAFKDLMRFQEGNTNCT